MIFSEDDKHIYDIFMNDLLSAPISPNRDIIIKKANNKIYHDFGPSPMPKILLYNDLITAGLLDMAEKVKRGVYDF